mgnify:CR=1 FL=1
MVDQSPPPRPPEGSNGDETATIAAEEPTILYQVLEGRVCVLTLNRPHRNNALTLQMQKDYFAALRRAERDERVVVVVVTGAGRSFCVGADMELLVSATAAPEKSADGSAVWHDQKNVEQAQMRLLTKPVVGAINGAAAGLGLVLALWCDVRFVSQKAKLTFSFSQRGLVAEHGISWLLPRIVGLSRALDLLLTSRVVKGKEAVALGLAEYDAPDGSSAVEAAISYARGLAANCSPAAMCEVRRSIYSDFARGADEASSDAISLMLASLAHPDAVEGVASYLERRPSRFEGLRAGQIRSRL